MTGLKARMMGSGVSDFRFLPETGSTNDDALAWAEQGAPDQALVAADAQTRGRGRLDRRWVTAAGSALAFSLIFRPTETEAEHVGLFSALGGIAVADALQQGWGLSPQIKWPNDVLLENRKVCGILSEAVWNGSRIQAVVLGIGVNVAPASVPPQSEVLFPAGSIEGALGRAVQRWDLLLRILEKLITWRGRLGQTDFMQAWEQKLAFRGKLVQIVMPDNRMTGTLIGVDRTGALCLRREDGSIETVLAGDVHLRPAV